MEIVLTPKLFFCQPTVSRGYMQIILADNKLLAQKFERAKCPYRSLKFFFASQQIRFDRPPKGSYG
jgi:hypothetical protein